MSPTEQLEQNRVAEASCEHKFQPPRELASNDPEVLRAALMRESIERRRAECRADMQTEVVKLALDLLVREPDIEGFFGGLAKTMVEESEANTCAVWLIDERPAVRACGWRTSRIACSRRPKAPCRGAG